MSKDQAKKQSDPKEKPPRKRPQGPPDFDSARCKSCGICIRFCPKGLLVEGPEGVPEIADPEACNACRICEYMCPDFAVSFRETEEKEAGGQKKSGPA
ncbi:MAG: hypothetical protein Kow00129_15610 [Thermoleophilia bacterium]